MRHDILVVEDDDAIRRLLVEYLELHAHIHVDSARDGIEALHQIALKQYSVVVLDVMMPHMSGVDFLDSLKALVEDPSVKSMERPPAIIVITSAPREDLPDEAIEHRFPVTAILRKPIDVGTLGAFVGRALRYHRRPDA